MSCSTCRYHVRASENQWNGNEFKYLQTSIMPFIYSCRLSEDSKVLAPLPQQLASKCPNACSVMSLCAPSMDYSLPRLLCPQDSISSFGDLPDPGSNPCLLPWQVYSLLLSYLEACIPIELDKNDIKHCKLSRISENT